MTTISDNQRRNVNRALKEVSAANNITAHPIDGDDLALALFMHVGGKIETLGKIPAENIPAALHQVADHIHASLNEGASDAFTATANAAVVIL